MPHRSHIAEEMRFLRIRLIGWYGFRATGDDLIAWSTKSLFRRCGQEMGIQVDFTNDGGADLMVVGGGTIIGCDSAGICERIDRPSSPVAVFGPGFRNMGEEACQMWQPAMKALFDRAVGTGVRGPVTAWQLKHYQMATNVVAIGDPAVWFERIPAPQRSKKGKTVGICIREMRNEGVEERYLPSSKVYERFAKLLPELLKLYEAEPVFLSFCENQFDSDSQGAEKLRSMLPEKYQDARIIPYSDNVRYVGSIIGQMDYLISERMHPTIIAWVQGKPCIAIDYQYRKTEDFMEGIGFPEYCIRIDDLDVNEYMDKLALLRKEQASIVQKSRDVFSYQRHLQEELASQILERTSA